MNISDEEYLRKEIKTLCDYLVNDEESFSKKKHAYARIYNSVSSILECQIGGIENISLNKEQVKNIIKEYVDNSNIKFLDR